MFFPRGGRPATIRIRTHPLVNPAMRVGWNGPGGTQWVVGLGAPIGFGRDAGEVGVFLYFSLEHAITGAARRARH
jgi:hypothetical protein